MVVRVWMPYLHNQNWLYPRVTQCGQGGDVGVGGCGGDCDYDSDCGQNIDPILVGVIV